MSKKLQLSLLIGLVLIALVVPVGAMARTTLQQSGNAYVLVGNFSPDSPPVNIYINGALLGSNLKFSQATMPATVAAGDIFIEVRNASNNAFIVNGYKNVSAGNYYMVPFMNYLERAQFGAYRLPLFEPLGANETRVQWFHAVPRGPRLDVFSVTSTTSTELVNAMGYVEDPQTVDHLTAGGYRFQLWTDFRTLVPGTQFDPSPDPDKLVFDFGNLTLKPRVIYSFFVIGPHSATSQGMMALPLAMPFGGGAPLAPPTSSSGVTLPTVSFGSASYSVSEGNSASLNIVMSKTSTSSVNVTYSTVTGGTATAGSDYVATSGTVTFSPGQTSKTITIPTVEDTIHEGTQTVLVRITGVSAVAAIGAPSTATLNINDDDTAPTLNLAAVSSVSEGGSVSVTATLSHASEATVTATLSTSGTAVNGTDYTLSGTTFTFSPGTTSRSVTLTAIADGVTEGSESLNLTLTQTSSTATNGTMSRSTTITDAAVQARLHVNTSSVTENGTVTFTISLTAPSPGGITVRLALSSGSADSGDYDFTSSTGGGITCTPALPNGDSCNLTFAAGEQTKTIVMTALNDADTVDQTLTFALSVVSGSVTLGTPNTQSIIIDMP